MNLLVLLASALLVQVPVDGPTPLRVVATGTGGHAVDWYVDGVWATTTDDGEAAIIFVDGPCDVWATTDHEGDWRALVRPSTGHGPGHVAYVEGWSVQHDAKALPAPSVAPLLLVLLGIGVVLVGGSRPKRP